MKCKMSYTFAQCSDKNEGNLKAIFGKVTMLCLEMYLRYPYNCFTDNGHKLCV